MANEPQEAPFPSNFTVEDMIVNKNLTVNGTTTQVDEIQTPEISVDDSNNTEQFRIDGNDATPSFDLHGNLVKNMNQVRTQGGGTDSIVFEDGANSNQTLLKLNEGGPVEVQNSNLEIGDSNSIVDESGNTHLTINDAGNTSLSRKLVLGADLEATDGETIWDESATEIPDSAMGTINAGTLNLGNALTNNTGSLALGSNSIQTDELDESAGFQFTSAIGVQDDIDLQFGTGDDIKVRWDSSNSRLEFNDGTNDLIRLTTGGNLKIPNGNLELNNGFSAFEMIRNAAGSGADIGQSRYKADDSNGNQESFVEQRFRVVDHTDGSEDGKLITSVLNNGSSVQVLSQEGVQNKLLNGNSSIPTLSFQGDTNTGVYNVSAGILGITAGGQKAAAFKDTGNVEIPNGDLKLNLNDIIDDTGKKRFKIENAGTIINDETGTRRIRLAEGAGINLYANSRNDFFIRDQDNSNKKLFEVTAKGTTTDDGGIVNLTNSNLSANGNIITQLGGTTDANAGAIRLAAGSLIGYASNASNDTTTAGIDSTVTSNTTEIRATDGAGNTTTLT